jgi:tetratricopeptide (TPR) repeat protein
MRPNSTMLALASVLTFIISTAAAYRLANFGGKTRATIAKELKLLEDQALEIDAIHKIEYRNLAVNLVRGCLMAESSLPNALGEAFDDSVPISSIASRYISDVNVCRDKANRMSMILKSKKKFGEALVFKELAVEMEVINRSSPADERLSNVLKAYVELGSELFLLGLYDQAKQSFSRALVKLGELGIDNEEVPRVLAHIASTELRAGNLTTAKDTYLQVLNYLRRFGGADKVQLGSALASLGSAHFQLGEYSDAEATYREAVAAFKDAALVPGDSFRLGVALKNLGATLYAQEKWEESAESFESALELYFPAINDNDYTNLNDTDEFRAVIDTAVRAWTKASNQYMQANNADPNIVRCIQRSKRLNQRWVKELKRINSSASAFASMPPPNIASSGNGMGIDDLLHVAQDGSGLYLFSIVSAAAVVIAILAFQLLSKSSPSVHKSQAKLPEQSVAKTSGWEQAFDSSAEKPIPVSGTISHGLPPSKQAVLSAYQSTSKSMGGPRDSVRTASRIDAIYLSATSHVSKDAYVDPLLRE